MDDLDRMAGGSGGVDPAYKAMFEEGLGQEESDRQVGREPVPQFSYYVVRPLRAFAGETQAGAPRVSPLVEITEGPEGTIGRTVLDAGGIYFMPAEDRKAKKGEPCDDNGRVPRTPEEMDKARKNIRGSLLRLQNHLKLGNGFPISFAGAAVEAYAEQFESAQPVVVEIQARTGTDGVRRNQINWYSVAALDANVEVKTPNGKKVMSAVEEAREKIAVRNKQTPRGKRKQGSTSRQFATPKTDPLS